MTIEQIIITLSYFGILLLMVVNGIIAFPSSQILYVVAGYFTFTRDLNIYLVIAIGALGHSIGNFILYEISRRKGLKYIEKLSDYLQLPYFTHKDIKKVQIAFNKKGLWFLFVGKLVNPIKIIISIPAGIAKMNRLVFFVIVYITSAIWATIFTLFGYFFGKSIENFGYLGIVVYIIALFAMYYFYKYINSKEIIDELEKSS